MKRIILLSFMLLLFGACKMQKAVAPFVLRDSISITYKQGTLTTPQGITLQPTTRNNESAIQTPRASPINPNPIVRVDTVFIERWHTEVCQPQAVCQRSGLSAEGGLSAKRSQFYKNCTWGFFILLVLILGRIALRITKAVCLRR